MDTKKYLQEFYAKVAEELDLKELADYIELGLASYVEKTVALKIAEVAEEMFNDLPLSKKQQILESIDEKQMKEHSDSLVGAEYDSAEEYMPRYVKNLMGKYISAVTKREEKAEKNSHIAPKMLNLRTKIYHHDIENKM